MRHHDKQQPRINLTGMAMAPERAQELIDGARDTRPSAEGSAAEIAAVRLAYAQLGETLGSVPPPATMAGKATTAAKAVLGDHLAVLTDKLGERLAFERSGTRLYDALLSKLDAYGSWPGGPEREDLERIREEERGHFLMLREAIEEMGGDPTAVTPSADVHAVASKGLVAVLADPRTNLSECLEAILIAELVDNDCWENLIDLAQSLGKGQLGDRFGEALTQEREHLRSVRLWLGAALNQAATGQTDATSDGPFAARAQAREGREAQREDGMQQQPARTPRAPGRKPSRRTTVSSASGAGKKRATTRSSQAGLKPAAARTRGATKASAKRSPGPGKANKGRRSAKRP